MFELWSNPLFLWIAGIMHASILALTILYYFLQKKYTHYKSSWSSVLSWLFLTPFIFIIFGSAWPTPLIFTTLAAIYGSKVFFQMAGMYHRSAFVYTTYAAIVLSAYCIYSGKQELFNFVPAISFLCFCLIPMVRNSYKNMIQYMALSLTALFLLWLFMHFGWIMTLEKGVFTAIYIVILTEIFENSYLRASRHLHRWKVISNITPKRSIEGYIIGASFTMVFAWLFQGLLHTPSMWWMIGAACFIFGSTGNSILVVIRRDMGIKVYESFIIGRGDFFTRIERLVFVAPAAYYSLVYLQGLTL